MGETVFLVPAISVDQGRSRYSRNVNMRDVRNHSSRLPHLSADLCD